MLDKTLLFSLRSASLIFTAVADALQWVMKKWGVTFTEHYIDSFITLGDSDSDKCARNVQLMLQACNDAGVPVEESKPEGPASSLTILRREIDSMAMVLRLPAHKLTQVQTFLKQWRGKKACMKQDLLLIVGSISHTCKVVRPGQTFLRCLIDLVKLAKHHHLCLSHEARSDLEWWF